MGRLALLFLMSSVMLVGVMLVYYSGTVYKTLPMEFEETLTGENYSEWQEFHSAVGRFRIMLPHTPQYAQEDLHVPGTKLILKYNMYIAEEKDGTTYMISLIEYPEGLDLSKKDAMLENVMNEMISSNPEAKLKSLEFTEYEGHRTLDFLIETPAIFISSRAFLAGRTLYLLTLIDKVSLYLEDDFLYFRNSFEFLNAEEVMNSSI